MDDKIKKPYFKKEKTESVTRFYCSSLQDAFHVLNCLEIVDNHNWFLTHYVADGKDCFLVTIDN